MYRYPELFNIPEQPVEPRKPTAEELDEYHDIIREWYLGQKLGVKDIQDILMKEPFYIAISKSSLERCLTGWGFRKNVKKKEYEDVRIRMIEYKKKRPLEETIAQVGNVTIPERKLRRYCQRSGYITPRRAVQIAETDPGSETSKNCSFSSAIVKVSGIYYELEIQSRFYDLGLERLPIFEFSRGLGTIIDEYLLQRMYLLNNQSQTTYFDEAYRSPSPPPGTEYLVLTSTTTDRRITSPIAATISGRSTFVDAFEQEMGAVCASDISRLIPTSIPPSRVGVNWERDLRTLEFQLGIVQDPITEAQGCQLTTTMDKIAPLKLLQYIIYRISNNLALITLLLVNGALVNMSLPKIGSEFQTALEFAAHNGRLDIVALLLNKGASQATAALEATPEKFTQVRKILRDHAKSTTTNQKTH
ncbi:hypothetical protein H072_11464 [Dactylellina haptotyla CBS 200.50]|uniref:Clr5 domain-containing protein n=1 Tax=Dactylellina haptotyla (strain CBS 200.50) TaxID=1284197 RepID=S8A273_DACHA|nr:hypothetical protein H072_11464 [Dactylellina haptotyla CBS 200.50]